ncbi:MAG: hypothetical protein ABW321_07985, partial [Polyangiales bacterium]
AAALGRAAVAGDWMAAPGSACRDGGGTPTRAGPSEPGTAAQALILSFTRRLPNESPARTHTRDV